MIIGGRKACGKTYELILISSQKEKPIWVADEKRKKQIIEMAKEMNMEIMIPMVLSKKNLERRQRSSIDTSLLIDDLEDVLSFQFGINIDVATTRKEMRNIWMN